MPQMLAVQAAPLASLPYLPPLHSSYGPPLYAVLLHALCVLAIQANYSTSNLHLQASNCGYHAVAGTWINNCVGHNNYRCFFCFLLHATAALTHSLLLLLAYALAGSSTPRTHAQLNVSPVRPHAEQQMPTNPSGAPLQSYSDAVYRSLAMVLSLLLLMSVGFLFVWHIQLLMRNKTTIEHHEGVNAKAIADSNGSPGVNVRKHPYDLGDPLTNFEAVLGKSPLRWIIPCDPSAEGDGFSFATRTELTHIAQPKPT